MFEAFMVNIKENCIYDESIMSQYPFFFLGKYENLRNFNPLQLHDMLRISETQLYMYAG
jgi:hypothetical protein